MVEEVGRDFDLFYRSMTSIPDDDEAQLNLDETDIGFFEGDGLFLADILAEQVNLALAHESDLPQRLPRALPALRRQSQSRRMPLREASYRARLAPLARLKQDWSKKQ